jgi:MoxR-like ATPase
MLRGERVRKSWLKDAEKNRFLRLDKVDDAERDQEQQVNSRQKRKKFSKPSASLAGIKQFEMDQCDTTAQIF